VADRTSAIPALKAPSERKRGRYLLDAQNRRKTQQSLNTVIAIGISRALFDEFHDALWHRHVAPIPPVSKDIKRRTSFEKDKQFWPPSVDELGAPSGIKPTGPRGRHELAPPEMTPDWPRKFDKPILLPRTTASSELSRSVN
jgi:hypothetical protein